jgi:hypothetical protein
MSLQLTNSEQDQGCEKKADSARKMLNPPPLLTGRTNHENSTGWFLDDASMTTLLLAQPTSILLSLREPFVMATSTSTSSYE